MLNPELLKEYGDSSVTFFKPLVDAIGVELADKCYAMTCNSYQYNGFFCTKHNSCVRRQRLLLSYQ